MLPISGCHQGSINACIKDVTGLTPAPVFDTLSAARRATAAFVRLISVKAEKRHYLRFEQRLARKLADQCPDRPTATDFRTLIVGGGANGDENDNGVAGHRQQ